VALATMGSDSGRPPTAQTNLVDREDAGFPVTVSPRFVVFAAGDRGEVAVSARNRSMRTIAIARVDSSCPCISVAPSRGRIEPGETESFSVAFEPEADEPDFDARLVVNVTGYSADGAVAFRMRAGVDSGRSLPDGLP
jgi:Protein of unknown function (DUF1573)